MLSTSRTGASRNTRRGTLARVPRSRMSGVEWMLETDISPTGGATALGK